MCVCVYMYLCVCVCVGVCACVHPADAIARVHLVEHMQVVQQLDSEQGEQQNWGPQRVPTEAEWAAETGAVVVAVGPPHPQTQQH